MYETRRAMFNMLDELCLKEQSMSSIFYFYARYSSDVAFETYADKKIKRVKYSEFISNSINFAEFFAKNINAPFGSIVRLSLPNSAEWCYAFWGLLMAGYAPFVTGAVQSETEITPVATVSSDSLMPDDKSLSKKGQSAFTPHWGDSVYFCSSGTTGEANVARYDGAALIKQIIAAKTFFTKLTSVIYPKSDGKIKNYAFLPFFHIFGFVAVFLWYTFFGKTIVFSNARSFSEVAFVCKKCRVTHLFAVPAFWEVLLQTSEGLIKTLNSLKSSLMQDALSAGIFGDLKYKNRSILWLKDRLLGRTIRLCISGGSFLDAQVMRRANSIYPLVNGFGMTELGVVSVQTSTKPDRLYGAIGEPLYGVKFNVADDNELIIDCSFAAVNAVTEESFAKGFKTGDVVSYENGEYVFVGRKKDVFVTPTGENVSIEALQYRTKGFFKDVPNSYLLFVENNGKSRSISVAFEAETVSEELKAKLFKAVGKANVFCKSLANIENVYSVCCLPKTPSGKYSRATLAAQCARGEAAKIEKASYLTDSAETGAENRVFEYLKSQIALLIGKEASKLDGSLDFFIDCGGNSLQFFELMVRLENEFGISLSEGFKNKDTTLLGLTDEICARIKL